MIKLNLTAGVPNTVELTSLYEAIGDKQIGLPVFQRSYLWTDEEKKLLLKSLAANLTIGSIILWNPVGEPNMPIKKIDGFELPDNPEYLILDGQQRMTFLSNLYREAESGLQFKGSYEYYIRFDTNASFDLDIYSEKVQIECSRPKNSDKDSINIKRLIKSGIDEINPKLSLEQALVLQGFLTRLNGKINVYVINARRSHALYLYQTCNMSGKQLKKLDIVEAVLSNKYKDLMKDIERFGKDISLNAQGHKQFKIFSESLLLRLVSSKLSFKFETYPKIGSDAVFDIFRPKYFPKYNKKAEPLTEQVVKKTWSDVKSCVRLFKHYLQQDLYYRGSDAMSLPSTVISILFIDKYKNDFDSDYSKRSKFYYWYLLNTLHNHYSGKSTNSKVDADINTVMISASYDGCIEHLLDNIVKSLQVNSRNDLCIKEKYFGVFGNERPEVISGEIWMYSEKLRVLQQMMWLNACRLGARDWKTDLLLEKYDKIEVHHIFPKSQFSQSNWKTRFNKLIDHPLNFAFITKRSNQIISKTTAEVYLPVLFEDFEKQKELQKQGIKQALVNRNELKRDNFFKWLKARSEHLSFQLNEMLEEIRDGKAATQPSSPEEEFLKLGKETDLIEFKSTFGYNLNENRLDDVIEFEIIKAINAFANARGGYLYIGVADDGTILGLDKDLLAFNENVDKLLNRIQQRCREAFEDYRSDILDPKLLVVNGLQVVVIKVHKALKSPNAAIKTPKKKFLLRYNVGPNQRLAFKRMNTRCEHRLI